MDGATSSAAELRGRTRMTRRTMRPRPRCRPPLPDREAVTADSSPGAAARRGRSAGSSAAAIWADDPLGALWAAIDARVAALPTSWPATLGEQPAHLEEVAVRLHGVDVVAQRPRAERRTGSKISSIQRAPSRCVSTRPLLPSFESQLPAQPMPAQAVRSLRRMADWPSPASMPVSWRRRREW